MKCLDKKQNLKFIPVIKKYWYRTLDIIYPAFCAYCAKSLDSLRECGICKNCLKTIKTNISPLCLRCGLPLNKALSNIQDCPECRKSSYYFNRALCVCRYDGLVKLAIHLIKYKRKAKLGISLAQIMADFLQNHISLKEIDIITAVPLHKHKMRERGFNQAMIFVEYLVDRFKLEYSRNNLRRSKKTLSQFSLPAEKRFKNVAGAFRCENPAEFKGKSVLLVDDIFTTGATLNECAKTLKQAGAYKVIAVSMAR